jgi:hypothetical protein
MTRGTEQGKKIDEIALDWDSHLIVRYHSSRYAPTFTVEAGNESFTGDNLKLLIEQATVYLSGWSKLKWEPIIAIRTEVYDDMRPSFERLFRSKHKGKAVYRRWRVGEDDEPEFGSYHKDKHAKTENSMDGVPGSIDRGPGGRIVAFTPERWTQLRGLRKMLGDAMEIAQAKLSKILADTSESGFDAFLKQISNGDRAALPFNAAPK